MDVALHLPDPADRQAVEALCAAYGDCLRLVPEPGPLRPLWLAARPLDSASGHGPGAAAEHDYGYQAAGGLPVAAVALHGRTALLPAPGPPREVLPGCWTAPFDNPGALRGAFHQAYEAALAEVREEDAALRARRPDVPDEEAAALLEVTPAALRAARGRIRPAPGALSC